MSTNQNKMPDIVVAQCQLYAAQAEVSLQITKDRMAGEAITAAQSRRLRAQREQLTAVRDAWAYLADIAREAAAETKVCGAQTRNALSGDVTTCLRSEGHTGWHRDQKQKGTESISWAPGSEEHCYEGVEL